MFSNRTLNYHSNHPLSLKKNIVFNLIDRAILLSDKRFHKRNISRVTAILIENSYPPDFIKKYAKARFVKINNTNNANNKAVNTLTI